MKRYTTVIFYSFSLTMFCLWMGCDSKTDIEQKSYTSDWTNTSVDRPWAGAEYWLNPLQAWHQKDGQLRCEISGGDRNVVLLTREVDTTRGSFYMSVHFEANSSEDAQQATSVNTEQNSTDGFIPPGLSREGWVGFKIGLKGQFSDYRDDAVKGIGLCAGYTTDGKLFIGDTSKSLMVNSQTTDHGKLEIKIKPYGYDHYQIILQFNSDDHNADTLTRIVHKSWIPGLLAISCSQSFPDSLDRTMPRPDYNLLRDLHKGKGGKTTFSFNDWKVGGDKLIVHDERAYGPILWAQYTQTDRIMKMSAQFVPLGNGPREAILLVEGQEKQRARIDETGNNALFRIEDWDDSRDHYYSIKYLNREKYIYTYKGTIKKDPQGDVLTLVSLSCVDDRGFPHQDLVDHVAAQKPDLLSFHGDQLYERVAGYGVERNSYLDYQRKWYVFGWSFGDLLRNIPAIIIPDDHDVFHGNLWGEGGKAADISLGYGYDSQDSGGYKEKPDFVNMVHRTQTGHLPDPYDSKPVKQNISVYYTNMNYGGVSFAILGDRQWKSAPKPLLPMAEIENGWPQNRNWDAKTQAFHPDAQLLGSRQEEFLENWVGIWDDNIEFKAVISQSPFCNVATLPAHIYHDKYVPGLPRYKKGEYPEDDRPVADFDSNGWPQNKRDKAVRTIRKAFALHITGDQHLGSTGQYGVDEYGDSGYWVSSPAVSNLWPRRWFPAQPDSGGKHENDTRRYTGNYEDGFGNKMTVKAIANPYDIDREPSMVFDKAPGYSVIRFNKKNRKIYIEVWPRWSTASNNPPDNKPYEGWPVVITQQENYGKKTMGVLDSVEVNGSEYIQVIIEDDSELLYALRPNKGWFEPHVFDTSSSYTIKKVTDGKIIQEIKGLKPQHN